MDNGGLRNQSQVPLFTPTLSLQIQPQQFISSFVFKQHPSFLDYCLMTQFLDKDFLLKVTYQHITAALSSIYSHI